VWPRRFGRRLGRHSPWPETWTHALSIAGPLPTVPLWLADDRAVPLELEESYEETCRILGLADV
jgi:hypothetical protein